MKARIEQVRAEVQKRLSAKVAPGRSDAPAPRYDDVFQNGVEWLDRLAGDNDMVNEREGQTMTEMSPWADMLHSMAAEFGEVTLSILDILARPEQHKRVVTSVGEDYVGYCACGWQTLPCVEMDSAYAEPCVVLAACVERARRHKQGGTA